MKIKLNYSRIEADPPHPYIKVEPSAHEVDVGTVPRTVRQYCLKPQNPCSEISSPVG